MSRWGGSSNHLRSRYQIFKFLIFFSFSIILLFFLFCFLKLHLNNHLHQEKKNKHQQEQQNNNNSDNHKIKAHKIQDGLSQSAFVTIAEAEKRQLDSDTLGGFWTVCLHVCLSHSRGIVRLDGQTETANCKVLAISFCRLQLTSFPPAKNSKVRITVWSYGMYPKLVLGDWKLKTVSSSIPHPNPLSLLSLLSIPLLRVCDLWSKASRQQRCRLQSPETGRPMGEESKRTHTSPMLFPNPISFQKRYSLTNKTESPVASLPPTNNWLDQY